MYYIASQAGVFDELPDDVSMKSDLMSDVEAIETDEPQKKKEGKEEEETPAKRAKFAQKKKESPQKPFVKRLPKEVLPEMLLMLLAVCFVVAKWVV